MRVRVSPMGRSADKKTGADISRQNASVSVPRHRFAGDLIIRHWNDLTGGQLNGMAN